MKRNANLNALKPSYLFPEVNMKRKQFQETHPEAQVISLGIGDTTEPLDPFIAEALAKAASELSTLAGYSGYGPEQGIKPLREAVAEKLYHGMIEADDVFISDGAKCDIGRLQVLFGKEISIAVQDPAYPVYVDGSLLQGVKKIDYLPCNPENDFFPELSEKSDLIYFCSPNNPTGAVATRQQLEKLVAFALKNRSIIIYDSAYASYIQDKNLPKSIYEIEGAKKVAIEISSFSKLAGFTGVRLGWTIVPKELLYEDATSIRADWNRITCTIFNGASNIAQKGALSVLQKEGLEAIQKTISFYLENAAIIKSALEQKGFEVYGGLNAPYLWVRTQDLSWNAFQKFLEKYHIVTTPGSGFGPSGEHFLRFTAFGKRSNILEAAKRLKN